LQLFVFHHAQQKIKKFIIYIVFVFTMDFVTFLLLCVNLYLIKIHFFKERRITDVLDEVLQPARTQPKDLHARMQQAQRKMIDKRLGIPEQSLWTKCGDMDWIVPCGIISLDILDSHQRYRNEKPVPMPLFKKNREYLEALGFVISEDQLWAIFRESDARASEGCA
jgi:hypothetical protein